MKATFENSVNVLVKAYLDDTLQHNNCHACAVGNLVAAACGYRYEGQSRKLYMGYHQPHWYTALIYGIRNDKEIKSQVESTGYLLDDLRKIEGAFEGADRPENGPTKEDIMFAGLMAVVEVLADIHGIDLTTKEKAKELFVKA